MLGKTWQRAIWLFGLAALQLCRAASGPALVVHDGTAGLEADVVSNLTGKLVAAGYTVTPNVGVPAGSLASFKQIWDVRFNNPTPLTGPDITAYVGYMAGGGSLFVMGENLGFIARDNSIVSLIQSAGGGTISLTTPNNVEAVQSPFTGPNAITTMTYLAAAGAPAPANGAYVTKDSSNVGAALVFGPGNMTNAPAGTLIVVFDVNFLQAGADATSQAFTANLIAFLAAPVVVAPPPAAPVTAVGAPTLSEWGMVLLACGLIFVAARKLRVPGAANLR